MPTSNLRLSPKESLTKEEQFRMVDAMARKELISFCIATDPEFVSNWHLELIANKLQEIESGKFIERGKKILIVQMPPRHGKSLTTTINFPAWFLGRKPTREVITCSYSGDLAQIFGGKTRTKVDSPQFKRIFPGVTLKEDEKAKAHWVTKEEGGYTSVGIGGALTGKGADLLIVDDPIKNKEEAQSRLIRDKHWDFFISTAYTRLEPGGVCVIIITRWHLDDLAGRVLANEELAKKVELISFPAIAEHDEQFRKTGDALWPMRYPFEELQSIKNALGPYDWNSLYQQSPILSANQEIKQEWIKQVERSFVERLNTRNVLTIDTAMSEKTAADYTGFCENYIDHENNWNVAAYRMRLNAKDLIDYIFTLHAKRSFEKIGIEKTAYTWGLKPFLDSEMRKRGVFLPIVELQHQQVNKETRIRGLIPRYASGSIYHIKGECNDLEEELLTFPKSIHDDVSDAAAYQLQIAEKAHKFNDPKELAAKYGVEERWEPGDYGLGTY